MRRRGGIEASAVEEQARVGDEVVRLGHGGEEELQGRGLKQHTGLVEDAHVAVGHGDDVLRPDRDHRIGWNQAIEGNGGKARAFDREDRCRLGCAGQGAARCQHDDEEPRR